MGQRRPGPARVVLEEAGTDQPASPTLHPGHAPQFVIARLRFKVLQAGQTAVRFSFSDWRATDAVSGGESVLGAVAAARVRGAESVLYLPVITKR